MYETVHYVLAKNGGLMCLGIPGKVLSISEDDDPILKTGRVSFGGSIKEISLAYVPDVKVDDYVIVHAGFALNIIDAEEADQVFLYLRQMGEALYPDDSDSDSSQPRH